MTRQALCFDATGTLIDLSEPVGEVYARFAKKYGVDLPGWRLDDAFQRVLRHAPPRGGDADRERREERRAAEFEWWSERIRQTFQATDSTVRFADFGGFAQALFDAYRSPECWTIRAGVLDTLQKLVQMGFEMAVVSNFDYRLIELLEALGLERFFSHTFVPSDTGARKPDRAAFEPAAERLGVPLSDLIYIGDDAPESLTAIAAHGLRVIDIRDLRAFEALTEVLAADAAIVSSDARGSDSPN